MQVSIIIPDGPQDRPEITSRFITTSGLPIARYARRE
jgi:hypothetical protein